MGFGEQEISYYSSFHCSEVTGTVNKKWRKTRLYNLKNERFILEWRGCFYSSAEQAARPLARELMFYIHLESQSTHPGLELHVLELWQHLQGMLPSVCLVGCSGDS